jgi:DNA-binding NarL/FixJ family response regulator
MFSNEKITIALADDDNIFKIGLKLILKERCQFNIIGEVANSTQLHQLTVDKHPDIILTDVKMTGSDIIATIRKISMQNPSTNIIVLSNHQEDSLIVNVIEAGARGYLLKDVSDEELYTAIGEVKKGNTYYCKRIADKVFGLIAGKKYSKAVKQKPVFSKTENEIIHCICSENTSKEISEKLSLSIRTVEGHRLNIARKLGVKTSVGVAIAAIKQGIYKIDWQLTK